MLRDGLVRLRLWITILFVATLASAIVVGLFRSLGYGAIGLFASAAMGLLELFLSAMVMTFDDEDEPISQSIAQKMWPDETTVEEEVTSDPWQ